MYAITQKIMLAFACVPSVNTHPTTSWHKGNYHTFNRQGKNNCLELQGGHSAIDKENRYTYGRYSVDMLPFKPAKDDVEHLETDWAVGCHLIGECNLDGHRCLVVFSHGHHLCHIIREPVW